MFLFKDGRKKTKCKKMELYSPGSEAFLVLQLLKRKDP